MSELVMRERKRREQNILDRLDNVRRLIEMETTILTVDGAKEYCRYHMVDRKGNMIGDSVDDMLHNLRGKIQLQLLSITALCYGNNPDCGEPDTMLEWKSSEGYSVEDKFRDTWEECLTWNA